MRSVWKMIELSAALALLFLAAGWCGQARETALRAAVFLNGEGLEKSAAENICRVEAEQEESRKVCLWGEMPDFTVSCQETGKISQVTVIACAGNPELAVFGGNLLAFRPEGCLIDEKTAEELFGTETVGGQTIWSGGQPYPVLGTFESAKQAMVRLAAPEDGPVLTCAVLGEGEEGGAVSAGHQFLLRHGLEGEIVDFTLLCAAAEDLLLIFPVVLAVSLCGALLTRSGQEIPLWGKLLRIGGACGALALMAWILKNHLQVPADMIPSRWSDFGFWADWWKNQRQNLLRIFATPLGASQLTMMWNLIRSGVCSLLAAGLGARAFRGL